MIQNCEYDYKLLCRISGPDRKRVYSLRDRKDTVRRGAIVLWRTYAGAVRHVTAPAA